jgi:ABC-type branched-subunit amino acid transport system ATPase component
VSAALRLQGVSKSFGGLKVIDDVGFEVPVGSRTALIGPNGAGKSTVFNLVSGVYPIDAGRIEVLSQDITQRSITDRVRLGIARSFQNIRLMPHLSTLENVMLGEHHRSPALQWISGAKATARAREALEQAGLGTYPGQVVADLPYGIQKRIEVVRAGEDARRRPQPPLVTPLDAGIPLDESDAAAEAAERGAPVEPAAEAGELDALLRTQLGATRVDDPGSEPAQG